MHTVSRAPSCDLVGDPLKLGFVTAELGSPPSTCTVRSFSVEDVGPFFRFWVWNKQSEIIFITVTKISSSGHQMTQPFHKIRWASEKNSYQLEINWNQPSKRVGVKLWKGMINTDLHTSDNNPYRICNQNICTPTHRKQYTQNAWVPKHCVYCELVRTSLNANNIHRPYANLHFSW